MLLAKHFWRSPRRALAVIAITGCWTFPAPVGVALGWRRTRSSRASDSPSERQRMSVARAGSVPRDRRRRPRSGIRFDRGVSHGAAVLDFGGCVWRQRRRARACSAADVFFDRALRGEHVDGISAHLDTTGDHAVQRSTNPVALDLGGCNLRVSFASAFGKHSFSGSTSRLACSFKPNRQRRTMLSGTRALRSLGIKRTEFPDARVRGDRPAVPNRPPVSANRELAAS
jgi:hypothetical protein